MPLAPVQRFGGASDNFFFTYNYPYSDPGVNIIQSLPFKYLGSGVGFHIAATLDLSLTDFIGVAAPA